MKKLIIALSLCLVLLLGIVFVLHSMEGKEPVVDTKPTETEQVNQYQVKFMVLDRPYTTQQVKEGGRPQQFQLQVEGLELVGWTDEKGNVLDPFTTDVTSDRAYTAVVYPQLQQQKTFLFVDEKGHLRPDDFLTTQELRMALTALAAPGATEYFPTLPEGDTEVALTDLNEMLKHFFRPDAVNGVLANVQTEKITRGAFAKAMSRLLEYTDADTVVIASGTKIPTDVTQDREDAIALLQASVSFFKDPAGVAWTAVELPVPYDPGFVNIDGWLYYVKEDGYFLKNDTVGTLQFGEDGRYTSGDATLDQTVATILDQIIKDNPDGSRMEILRDLRMGKFDVLVGINLLREGLDLPEVSLVAVLDADKEGFLRSTTSLIQTIGRAARNAGGQVILYADTVTASMAEAMGETQRRRTIQKAYNDQHGIVPKTIIKSVRDLIEISRPSSEVKGRGGVKMTKAEKEKEIARLEKAMREAARMMEFEYAAVLRDQIIELRK